MNTTDVRLGDGPFCYMGNRSDTVCSSCWGEASLPVEPRLCHWLAHPGPIRPPRTGPELPPGKCRPHLAPTTRCRSPVTEVTSRIEVKSGNLRTWGEDRGGGGAGGGAKWCNFLHFRVLTAH